MLTGHHQRSAGAKGGQRQLSESGRDGFTDRLTAHSGLLTVQWEQRCPAVLGAQGEEPHDGRELPNQGLGASGRQTPEVSQLSRATISLPVKRILTHTCQAKSKPDVVTYIGAS